MRGGTGLFSGRLPLVFFTNMPTNGGMVQYQAQLSSKNTDMNQFAGGLVKEEGKSYTESLRDKLIGMGYPSTVTPDDGTKPSSISAVDPNFKMPQVWKTSLAFDYTVPTSFPFTLSVEGIYNKTINAAMTKSITTNCLFNGNIPSDIGGGKHWNAIYENVTGTPTLTDSRQSNRPLFNEGRDSRAHWYMPRANSPARDSGVDHFYTESSLDADRKKRLNGAVDIGCFEYWPGGFATQLLLY
jgi:hypothetical protein